MSQALAVRAELDKAKGSPVKKAGLVAGGIVLVGGGPEDLPADVVAAAAFLALLAMALVRSTPKADPEKIKDLLDQIKDSLRKPVQKREPEQKPEPKPKPPLGPDIAPRQPLHQGNIHVQGDDVRTAPNFAWSQPVPATKTQGLGGLAQVKGQCTKEQLRDRGVAFARAERFINTTLYTAPPPLFRTFQNPEVIGDPNKRTRRVDIEIVRGAAFA
jgi:hypothetical protein